MKEINLVTSSDSGYVKHIFTQLKNISDNLVPLYEVHLWFFHYTVTKEEIAEMAAYADFLGIKFHEVFVYDYDDYEPLRKGGDKAYKIEGYLYYLAHRYLPESIDRVLCIDSGDIIFDGDIGEYYFAPFKGNFISATFAFGNSKTPYNFDDLSKGLPETDIVMEYFNAGVIMLNLELMRIFHIDLKFFENIADYIIKQGNTFTSPFYNTESYYTNDQGLIAAAFVGNTLFWDYDKYGFNPVHMPYNFRPFVFEENRKLLGIPDDAELNFPYTPKIIHLIGNKPWATDKEKYDSLLPISKKYLDMFWEAEREAKAWLADYRASKKY
jgi:lipopolysaccharide biosynthesis glycosyltransferase